MRQEHQAGRGARMRPWSRGPQGGQERGDGARSRVLRLRLPFGLKPADRQESGRAAHGQRRTCKGSSGCRWGTTATEGPRLAEPPLISEGQHKRGSQDRSTRGQTPLRPAGWLEAVVLSQSHHSGLVEHVSTGLWGF